MITAIVVPDDPKKPIRLAQLDEPDFDDYGQLEAVSLVRPPAIMYFNEGSKALEMPVNRRATALRNVHASTFPDQDPIYGPAFIVGPNDTYGDDTSAPPDLIDLLLHTARYRVQVTIHGRNGWIWSGDRKAFADWFEAYTYGSQVQRWAKVEEVRVVPVLDEELRETWYQLGLANPSIGGRSDSVFGRSSVVGCYSVEELAERISGAMRTIGTAFYYRDLCFIRQVPGGDKWLAIRHGIAIESIELLPPIANGTFASLVHRLLTASKEQWQRAKY